MQRRKHLLEARFCAVGGQGIVLGTEIIATAAIFHEGLYALQSPTYGSQVRGGPTKVDVVIDKKPVLTPKATNVNFFMAIAQSSFNKFWKEHEIAEDAVVLLDSNLVAEVPPEQQKSRTFFRIPVVDLAKNQFNNVLLSNMICLGVTQHMTQFIQKDSYLAAIREKVPPKHLDKNIEAFELGIQLASQQAGHESPAAKVAV